MGIVNELETLLPGREGQPSDSLPKYERTAFDFVIIGIGYLFMPLGVILALVRLIGTHYKNYRKPVNYSLLYHAFVGGFVQMMAFTLIPLFTDGVDTTTFIIMLIVFTVIMLLPAGGFAASAAKARFRFSQLTNQYVQLITQGGVRYIGNLADRTGQSEADVDRDLIYLQKYGVLAAGIVFGEGTEAADSRVQEGSSSPFSSPGGPSPYQPVQPSGPPQLPKSVRCPGCGAQNTVSPGRSISCEYCGTTIAYS